MMMARTMIFIITVIIIIITITTTSSPATLRTESIIKRMITPHPTASTIALPNPQNKIACQTHRYPLHLRYPCVSVCMVVCVFACVGGCVGVGSCR